LCLRCRTATFKGGSKEQKLSPYWFEMMAIPFNMPTFSENLQAIVTFSQAFLSLLTPLQITFSNYHKPKHEVVASLNFKLKDVTSNPTRFAPAVWYGSSVREFSSLI
jgi:hypothetical protein